MRKDMLFAVAVAIGAILVTTGGVVFRGDIMQELHAFDTETGTALWNSAPPAAAIQTSTITFAVDGKKYVTVENSSTLIFPSRIGEMGCVSLPSNQGTPINMFALPE